MSKLKILVVEGERGLRSMMVLALQKYYEVSEAADRDDVLAYLGKELDVILMELFLPPRQSTLDEGFYVLKKFKERAPEIKIIIVTTATEKAVIDKAKELGADAYIKKPFEIETLKEVIEEVSRSVPLGRERRKYWRDKEGKPVGIEKRRYWRVSCELPIHYSLLEGKPLLEQKTRTINISYGGVMFPVETPISSSSLLDMKLFLPSHLSALAIKAIGKVRWIKKFENKDRYRLGVRFVEMKYASRKIIAGYIYERLAN